jgi:hypothetical protein
MNIREFAPRDQNVALLWTATGLEHVEETAFEIQMDFSSFDDFWSPLLGGVGPSGVYVAELSAPRRDALRQALRERLLAGGPDRPLPLDARAWAVRGSVPR